MHHRYSNINVLIVDTNSEDRDILANFLKLEGFRVTIIKNLEWVEMTICETKVDLIILEVFLSNENGFELCRRIRSVNTNIPIIFLTSASNQFDREVGLEIGGDDYITKPFYPRELLARIKNILRHYNKDGIASCVGGKQEITFGSWVFKVDQYSLWNLATGESIVLSSTEFRLLMVFLKHPQQVLTRDRILRFVSNREHEVFDRTVDIQVSRLRKKLEADKSRPTLIVTVRGGGYRFAESVIYRNVNSV